MENSTIAATANISKTTANASKVPGKSSGLSWKAYLLQILIGLVVLIILFVIANLITRTDKSSIDNAYTTQKKISTKLVDGFVDAGAFRNHRYNTSKPASQGYVNLSKSVNHMGGAQFTYSFWVRKDTNTNNDMLANKNIFLQGDLVKYSYVKRFAEGTASQKDVETVENDYVIHSPLVSFGNSGNILIQLNTLHNVKERIVVPSTEDRTFPNLTAATWLMYTIVVEDNKPINDFENGIVVQVYLNDVMYHVHKIRSTLRQNNGDFYLFPESSDGSTISGCKIGNVTYYNYALHQNDVRAIFLQGPPKSYIDLKSSAGTTPLEVSEYNKLDLYPN